MSRSRIYTLGVLLAIAAWVSASAAGAAVAYKPVEVLAREAELVAVATVLSVRDDPSTSSAVARLELERVLKTPPGFNAKQVDVLFPTVRAVPGTGMARATSGGPRYVTGERVVVFLTPAAGGASFETVGGALGRRRIDGGRVEGEDSGIDQFLARIRAVLDSP